MVARTQAARLPLDPIDPADEGASDYAGPLLSDVDFAAFSHSALVRIADEVCLQMHLLNLSFGHAVRQRAASDAEAREIATKQLVGVAGIAAERLSRALALDPMRTLELHPLLNPVDYVVAETESSRLHVHASPAHDDESWISLCSPESVQSLQAIATAVDPHIEVRVSGTASDWTAELVETDTATEELPEVSVVRISGGSSFQFEPRRSLPLTVL